MGVYAPIDWDALQIVETVDEEGRLKVANDDELYALLGFKEEDERAERLRKAATTSKRSARAVPHIDIPDDGAALPVDDSIPEEQVISYDPDNPEMKLGALFPSMAEFRLAVIQWAINKEFELGISKTDRNRYDGYCKGSDNCPWHIHARPKIPGGDIMCMVIIMMHKYWTTVTVIQGML